MDFDYETAMAEYNEERWQDYQKSIEDEPEDEEDFGEEPEEDNAG